MLGAGTGISPMLRMIWFHIENADHEDLKKMRICLLWWVTTEDEAFIPPEEFRRIQKLLGHRFFIRVQFTRMSLEDLSQSQWARQAKHACKADNDPLSFQVATGRDMESAMKWCRQQFSKKDPSIPLSDKSVLGLICGPDVFVRDAYRTVKLHMLSINDRFLVL